MTQKEALDILKLGHNVFLTGAAGSGKTFLLNQYIAYLKQNNVSVGITASTGIAATHMGGTTIHSWAGMGIKDELTEQDLRDLAKRNYLWQRFKKTKVLIIDEISMLHAHRLDIVDLICRTFKNNGQPFGGLQIVMCGDFFQLPPVVRKTTMEEGRSKMDGEARGLMIENQTSILYSQNLSSNINHLSSDSTSNFVFNSEVWQSMNLKVCYLEEQHRQDDRTYLRVLNDIRNGEVDEMTFEYLAERLNKDTVGYARPTRLFTHNADVDAINAKHLQELQGEEKVFPMEWRGSFGIVETLKKSCLAPESLKLKKGAQVMFVKNNYEAGYVNGTIGEVIDFKDELPIVRTFDGNEITVTRADWEVKEDTIEKAAITQLPLRLAWAITVHKSQGMSLDAAEVDLSRSFVPGMGYVALSRVRSLSGLKLMGMNQVALQINPQVAEMDQGFHEQSHEAILELQDLKQQQKEEKQTDFLSFLQTK